METLWWKSHFLFQIVFKKWRPMYFLRVTILRFRVKWNSENPSSERTAHYKHLNDRRIAVASSQSLLIFCEKRWLECTLKQLLIKPFVRIFYLIIEFLVLPIAIFIIHPGADEWLTFSHTFLDLLLSYLL